MKGSHDHHMIRNMTSACWVWEDGIHHGSAMTSDRERRNPPHGSNWCLAAEESPRSSVEQPE
jgi:hypothetical protein